MEFQNGVNTSISSSFDDFSNFFEICLIIGSLFGFNSRPHDSESDSVESSFFEFINVFFDKRHFLIISISFWDIRRYFDSNVHSMEVNLSPFVIVDFAVFDLECMYRIQTTKER